MLRSMALLAVALLLATPSVAASHENTSCPSQGVVPIAQCLANFAINVASHEGQNAVRLACEVVFGEPC